MSDQNHKVKLRKAHESFALSQSLRSFSESEELNQITIRIEESIKNGEYEHIFLHAFSQEAIKHLESMGYVVITRGITIVGYSGPYAFVSWAGAKP